MCTLIPSRHPAQLRPPPRPAPAQLTRAAGSAQQPEVAAAQAGQPLGHHSAQCAHAASHHNRASQVLGRLGGGDEATRLGVGWWLPHQQAGCHPRARLQGAPVHVQASCLGGVLLQGLAGWGPAGRLGLASVGGQCQPPAPPQACKCNPAPQLPAACPPGQRLGVGPRHVSTGPLHRAKLHCCHAHHALHAERRCTGAHIDVAAHRRARHRLRRLRQQLHARAQAGACSHSLQQLCLRDAGGKRSTSRLHGTRRCVGGARHRNRLCLRARLRQHKHGPRLRLAADASRAGVRRGMRRGRLPLCLVDHAAAVDRRCRGCSAARRIQLDHLGDEVTDV